MVAIEEQEEEPDAARGDGAGAPEEGDEAGDAGAEDGAEEGGAEGAEGRQKHELDKGKEEYQKGNYEDAIKAWSRSLQSVKYILEKGIYAGKDEQLKEVYDMEVKVCLNMAQGYLKTNEYNKAIESAEKVLAREKSNTKALYRKASALKQLLSFSEAAAVLEQLLRVESDNAAAKAMLAEVRRNAQRSERKEKQMSQKMLKSLAAERDPRVPPTTREAVMEFLWSAPSDALQFVRSRLEQYWEATWSAPRRLMKAARGLLEAFLPRALLRAAGAGGAEDKKRD